MRKRPISLASEAQRRKVKDEGHCRRCGNDGSSGYALDPAHVVGRDLGGCDHALCVVPLCRICHRFQEDGGIDLLPHLSLLEQAHGVSHVGVLAFLHIATGERYVPEKKESVS